jgi:hypothetical protein
VLALAGCAAAPTEPVAVGRPPDPGTAAVAIVPEAIPLVESPPIEPVEPPLPLPSSAAAPATVPPPALAEPAVPPPAASVVIVPAEPTAEEREFAALLADLQRYGGLSAEDQRRELNAMTQALARQRTDVVRVRLAVLYTLTRATPQDDQRALQLFDNVARGNPGNAAVKQLAAVLSVQVAERVRAVREEQQRGEAAVQKLEALRAMERSLLRDRVRSGGGGAGGAGSGGGSGGQ